MLASGAIIVWSTGVLVHFLLPVTGGVLGESGRVEASLNYGRDVCRGAA